MNAKQEPIVEPEETQEETEETTEETGGNSALKNFVGSATSKYLKFDETNTIEGVYLGCRMEDDPFNPGQVRMVYEFEIDQQPKVLNSGSNRLAKAFLKADPKLGQFIRVIRVGEGFNTNYKVDVSDLPF